MRCACGRENSLAIWRCPQCGKRLAAGADPWRLSIDAAALAGLLAALGIVFLLDRRRGESAAAAAGVAAASPESVELPPAAGQADRPLQLAVTPPEYDDMGKMLDALGRGYRYTSISLEDILDAERLRKYDVVFLTCGGAPLDWLGKRTGGGQRESEGVFRVRPEIVRRIHDSLRDYVGGGGTLYASDWRFALMEIAFPEFIAPNKAAAGAAQTVRAEVLDPAMQKRLGVWINLNFDEPGWQPAAFDPAKATAYLRGEYRTLSGRLEKAALLAQFPFRQGHVVFTSFHNESQNSRVELELLRSLVFTAIHARLDASVRRTMIRGGFSPVERNLLSASPRAQPLGETFQCRGAESLQFVLGFEDRGARLRLTIISPDGVRTEKEGDSTFTIEISPAAAGPWQYTVSPIRIPYPNFPFSVTVGERQEE